MTVTSRKDIFDFFPIPRILRMPAVGVDVSDESVKFIELKSTSKGIAVGKFGKLNIPTGAIVGGEVKNMDAFVGVLRRVKERCGFDFVHASLPEQHAFVFQTKVPAGVRPRDMRSVLEFKIEENVPLKSNEAVFDFSVRAASESERYAEGKGEARAADSEEAMKGGETDSLYIATVSVYQRTVVEAYSQAFRDAGLYPISFEIETLASADAVVPKSDEGTYMVVDFGRSQAGIAVVARGELAFTATLDVGGDSLNNAIMKTFSVSQDEAERMKNEKGLINSEKNRDLFTALITTVAAFKDELSKHYNYWNTHDGTVGPRDPIDKIILCGGNANLPGLPEYLTQAMGIPVSRADVWANVKSEDGPVPPIERRYSLEYATVIGLALRSLYL